MTRFDGFSIAHTFDIMSGIDIVLAALRMLFENPIFDEYSRSNRFVDIF